MRFNASFDNLVVAYFWAACDPVWEHTYLCVIILTKQSLECLHRPLVAIHSISTAKAGVEEPHPRVWLVISFAKSVKTTTTDLGYIKLKLTASNNN